jgi:NAD(P)-dependent dehydrogenase (short-subunit alcohol dehydrogenase family)
MASRDNLFDLKDKVAIVTGAGSGLGEAIAVGYAEYGAAVAVVDLDEASAKRVAQIIVDRGGQAVPLTCNVSNPLDVQAVVASLISEFNRIDILVNNAGIGRRSEAEEMSDDMWRTVLDVNLNGAFFFCRDVGREMIKRGAGGRIINMASIGGVVGVETGNANYCASKGGLIAMTRCLAIEWAKHGILVNAIAPTHMRTPLIEKLLKEKPEVETYFLNNIPLGRLGDPGDILGPAVFLASEAASFVTGHVLLVDGGHTAK